MKPRASPSHGVSSFVHLDFSPQLVFLTKLIVCAWPYPRGYLNTEDLIHFASSYSLWTWYLQICCAKLENDLIISWLYFQLTFSIPMRNYVQVVECVLNRNTKSVTGRRHKTRCVVCPLVYEWPWKQLSVSLTFWQPQQKSSSEPRDFRLVQYTK